MSSTGLEPFRQAVSAVVSADILLLAEFYDDDRVALAAHGLAGANLDHRTGGEAIGIAEMIGALPPAEQMRCHMPRYGVVLELSTGGTLGIAICFKCNNARTFEDGVEGWSTFDGQSPGAIRLLGELRGSDPNAAHVSSPHRGLYENPHVWKRRTCPRVQAVGVTNEEARDSVRAFGSSFRGRLDDSVLDDDLEYVDFNECVLALDVLASHLFEHGVRITEGERATFRRLLGDIGGDLARVSCLDDLVN